jgi:hypothetical protein
MTINDLLQAVTDAGFTDPAELTIMLKTSRLLVQRNALAYSVGAKQAAKQVAAAAADADIQSTQSQIAAIDTALTQGT